MIDYYFSNSFIKGNELTFYIFIAVILLIIIFTFIIGYKEIKKNENK